MRPRIFLLTGLALLPLLILSLASLQHAPAATKAQAPLAKQLLERVPAEVRPDAALLHPAERDAMESRAARIVDAINLFRARTATLPMSAALVATCLAPVGADCLVYLGSSGSDTYA